MDYSDWIKLEPDQQSQLVHQLNIYTDWDLFKKIEAAFSSQYGNKESIGEIFCGVGPGLGPYYGIFVEIKPNFQRTKLPKKFMGFTIFRRYHHN